MAMTRAITAAALFLAACGLNTFGLADGSTDATTMSDGSTLPTGEPPPAATTLQLSFSQIKQFDFSWSAVPGADYYQLLERPTKDDNYGQVGDDIIEESISVTMPLHFRLGASYILRACNGAGCTDSEPLDVVDSMAAAVGYFKASKSGAGDTFGYRLALSADGSTLVVGARYEKSNAGAVYVFVRENKVWSQQAYLKASNSGAGDLFGASLAVSENGDTLAVGAFNEDNDAMDIDATNTGAVYVFVRVDGVWSERKLLRASNPGNDDSFGASVALSAGGDNLAVGAPLEDGSIEADDSIGDAGAAYVFVRVGATWSQTKYLKAFIPGAGDEFGSSVALSADGNTLTVGAPLDDAGAVCVFMRSGDNWSQPECLKASTPDTGDNFGHAIAMSADGNTLAVSAVLEASNATGIGGDQADNSLPGAGAVYVFVRANNAWSQQAYVKASNTGAGDRFGSAVAVSTDGDTLAVGAGNEPGTAVGIGGAQTDNPALAVGAAYVFLREGIYWSQRAHVKASNSGSDDRFGYGVALSADGNTLAVGAHLEDSASIGISGNQTDNTAPDAGAVYLY